MGAVVFVSRLTRLLVLVGFGGRIDAGLAAAAIGDFAGFIEQIVEIVGVVFGVVG